MIKNKLKLFLIIAFLIIFSFSSFCFADLEEDIQQDVLISPNPEAAQNTLISPNPETEQSTEVVKSSDEYLIGTDITVDYNLEGNLYIIANNVTISSRVIGSAFICANNVNITKSGYISNELYVAGQTVTIDGYIYDIYAASEDFTFAGSTYRDIHCAAKNIELSGAVGRDAALTFENINFTDKAIIFGDLDYTAENKVQIPSTLVEGNTKFTKSENIQVNLRPNYFMLAASFVVLTILLWLIFKWLAPNFIDTTGKLITNNPFKTFGIGLLALICIPVIAVLLIIARLSAVLGVVLLLSYIIFACISMAVFVIGVNTAIAKKLKFEKTLKPFLLLLVTSAVAWALTLIPFAGAVFDIIYGTIGFGIIIRNLICRKEKNSA